MTKCLTQCLEWYEKDVKDAIASATFADPANSDLTSTRLYHLLGQVEGLENARDFNGVFTRYEMMEVANV